MGYMYLVRSRNCLKGRLQFSIDMLYLCGVASCERLGSNVIAGALPKWRESQECGREWRVRAKDRYKTTTWTTHRNQARIRTPRGSIRRFGNQTYRHPLFTFLIRHKNPPFPNRLFLTNLPRL